MFQSINTAVRGMQAQQKALETLSHNVANANTPGFSRQRVMMSSTSALSETFGYRGQVGTGVEVTQIQRIRTEFLDSQWRKENMSLAEWQVRQNALQQTEVILTEPSDSGLGASLNDFWNSWQELVKNPESMPVRTTVVESANVLAQEIRETYSSLEDLAANLNNSIEIDIIDVNSLAGQIADLNDQIIKLNQARLTANDLLDKRDLLLDQLSGLLDYTLSSDPATGAVTVAVDGRNLVQGVLKLDLQSVPDANGNMEVQWADSGQVLQPGGGELAGYMQARSKVYSYQGDLDRLARGLIEQVNLQHRQGYDLDGNTFVDNDGDGLNDTTGYADFFTGTRAADMAVTQAIQDNPRSIAAAAAGGGAGDGANALALAGLRRLQLESGNGPLLGTASLAPAAGSGESFEDFYQGLIENLGIYAQQANRQVTNQQALVDQVEGRRQEISGVSLDEETAGLIQYQRAFEASSKVISVLDEMLDTLINRMF